MDIILIKPDFSNKQITRDATRGRITFPHGLIHLAAVLRQKNYDVLILDEVLEKDPQRKLLDALKTNPICVGICTTTGTQINFAIRFAEIIRANSRVPIVWGGPHPTIWAEQTLEDDLVDMVVVGEGEYTFAELVSALEKGDSISHIRGLGYKDQEGVHINPPAELCDLDLLPDLPYDLVNMEPYIGAIKKRRISRGIEIITSRGCPFSCSFCHNSIQKNPWRKKSVGKIISEIEYLRTNYNIDGFLIEDENFFVSKKRVIELCEELLRRNIRITIRGGGIRANQLASFDKQTLQLLRAAGFDHFGMGIESGSPRVLEILNKHITLDQIYKANQNARDHGFAISYNFMSGVPGEEISDYVETLKLILFLFQTNEHLIAPVGVPKFFYPDANTLLGKKCLENDFKPRESLREWGKYDYTNFECSWRSKDLESLAIKAMHIVRDLQDKFTGENAHITEDDYRPLKDLIEIASVLSAT